MRLPIVEKSVNGKFPIGLVYSAPDLDETEKISAVTCTITPTEDDGLETTGVVVIAADGKSFYWTIQKGIKNHKYNVLFKIVSDLGKIFEHPEKEGILVVIV